MASNKHTTSIVDISEIEDDEAPMEPPGGEPSCAPGDQRRQAPSSQADGHQQQYQQQQQRGFTGAASGGTSAHLYLYHEDLHPHQRIPNLLSTMIINSQLEQEQQQQQQSHQLLQQPHAQALSRDSSPGQTLLRPGGLPAIDYYPSAQRHQQQLFGSSERAGCQQSRPDSPGADEQQQRRPITPAGLAASDKMAAAGAQGAQKKANLGTLSGVYFPCVQNIFGVILFIRMVWIVGTAGVPAAFSLVFICCCVTLTTSISLSAIATNGIVPAGGSYFMISRSLGPECGGAVGTMFFLGTTFAGAMYITGAVEIMLNYLAPSWGLFGDFQRDVSIMYNNIRVYGTLLLIIVGLMVWIGVKFVSKLAPIALFCVLFSIFSIYVGIFVNYNGRPDLSICVVGDRLVTLKNLPYSDPAGYSNDFNDGRSGSSNATARQALAEQSSQFQQRRTKALCTFQALSHLYCPSEVMTPFRPQNNNKQQQDQQASNEASGDSQAEQQQPQSEADAKELLLELFRRKPNLSNCDPYFWANKDRIHLEQAVPGIASGALFQNLKPRFRTQRTIVSYDDGINTNEKNNYNNVFVDITTSFTILISIYFPSCTGILAGSNRSGDLADAQKSIPRGTIAAQLTTSFVYLSCIVLFGSTFNNLFIRDKFGESMGGQLAVTQIAWPHPYVILIGGLLSTLGASLQSLVGAPRILQGIAKDEVIPCFNRFAKLSPRGEPETAILFTLGISWLAVLIGNLDFIAPILTLSLVMCYFFINLACTLHSLLGSPNWRPRFKHYHWSISTLGCILCLFVMIVSSWLYFLIAIFLAGCIYKYIEFSGAEKEWGDGKQGLALSAARYNLLRLKTSEPHTKNWRPQILLFCKLKPISELEPPSAQVSRPRAPPKLGHHQLAITSGASACATSAHLHHQNVSPAGAGTSANCGGATTTTADLLADSPLKVAHPKLLTFASQLKAGKGLTLVSSVIEGNFKQAAPLASRARATLQECMQAERVKGFADVLIAPSIADGLSYQVQTAGLGGLKHNTVIVGWPDHWRRSAAVSSAAQMAAEATAMASTAAAAGTVVVSGASAGGSQIPAPVTAASSAAGGEQGVQRGSFKNANQAKRAARTAQQATQTRNLAQASSRAHQFIELMRDVQVSQNALLVVKGVDSWPESCDKLGGFIDIWWIVNDGGLLMLLPHLLKQHRTWKSCQLRIFTVAQASDNSVQMREDLRKFLYHLRIEAQVDIVEMNNTEISDYAYERTLMMEQRTEIIKRLNVNRKQSLLLEQEVDGRLIRFRIRKPSTSDFEDANPFSVAGSPLVMAPGTPVGAAAGLEHYPLVEVSHHSHHHHLSNPYHQEPSNSPPVGQQQQANGASLAADLQADSGSAAGGTHSNNSQQQQTANNSGQSGSGGAAGNRNLLNALRPDEANVRRMHTALTLNEAILKRSKSAKLVIINLPGAPKDSTPEAENNYMEFIEIITDKLERVLLVQNGGREVITIHS